MNRFERDLIRFVVQWLPYGGPPECEAMVEFGLTPAQLIERCRTLVGINLDRRLPVHQDEGLVRVAARFLGLEPMPNPRGRTVTTRPVSAGS